MLHSVRTLDWGGAEPYRTIADDAVPPACAVGRFHDLWQSLRPDDGVPSRRDFAPSDVPQLAPWLMILDLLPDCGYRYRLCGTGCASLFGIDYTGMLLGDRLPPDAAEIRRREFERVLHECQPLLSQTRVPLPGREFIAIFRGVFPFARHPEGVPDQVVVAVSPAEQELPA